MIKYGDRVELVHCTDQYTQLKRGEKGVVTGVREQPHLHKSGTITVIDVKWDSGSTLSMIPEAGDSIRKVPK